MASGPEQPCFHAASSASQTRTQPIRHENICLLAAMQQASTSVKQAFFIVNLYVLVAKALLRKERAEKL